jgi:hypothetical protein
MNLFDTAQIIDAALRLFLVLFAVAVSAALTSVLVYFLIIYNRLKKREQLSLEMITLEVKLPKDNEIKVDAAEQMFAAFGSLKKIRLAYLYYRFRRCFVF